MNNMTKQSDTSTQSPQQGTAVDNRGDGLSAGNVTGKGESTGAISNGADTERDKLLIRPDPDQSDIAEGREVHMGEPLDAGDALANRESLIEALRQVYDPEIPVNIYDLGLIYELHQADNGDVRVVMTLTAPACPVAGEMPKQVAEVLAVVEGVGRVRVQLTWQPAWTMDNMSADAKLALGFGL